MTAQLRTLVTGILVAAALHTPAGAATAQNDRQGESPNYSLSCPPDFLTDTEQRMFTKEGTIRSGPWHVRCFQNGTGIYDRDRMYLFCGRGDAHASLEGADGHAIRFQFPANIACIWER